jgi:hypothetical protein
LNIQPGQRVKLERLCRYVSRPPVAQERLTLSPSGQVRYALKSPYRDGATHIVLEPLDLMGRLAALVPPPRMHLTGYHGVFAIEIDTCAHCHGRPRVIASIEDPEVITRILPHLDRASGLRAGSSGAHRLISLSRSGQQRPLLSSGRAQALGRREPASRAAPTRAFESTIRL